MSSPLHNVRTFLSVSFLTLAGGVLMAGPAHAAGSSEIIPTTSSATPSITDIAGTGMRGFSGDGGVAVKARLALPIGVAEDAAGNLYIADTANDRIRKVVDPTMINQDIIATIAGQGGRRGFSGDSAAATMARLDNPTGLAVDSQGNVFFADSGNNRVREIGAGGTINTIAGNGHCGSRGTLGNSGLATEASLCNPTGIAVDAKGDVFVADSGHDVVREVTPNGTMTTFAGTGRRGLAGNGGPAKAAELDDPTGLAVDALGNLYIADSGNNEVRVVNARGIIEDFAGLGRAERAGDLRLTSDGDYGRDGAAGDPPVPLLGDNGPAVKARLAFPTGVTVDPSGNVFIADTGDNRLREVSGGIISTYAGNGRFGNRGERGDGGPATSAELRWPTGVATDGAAVYFADTGNDEIRGVFTGPPPVLPETPFLIALPGAAILIAGAGYFFLRRRRAAASS